MNRENRRLGELVTALRARCAADAGAVRVIRSPLRVCLLGAHVDHQLGKVAGLTLNEAVLLAFVPREDGHVRLWSTTFAGAAEFDLEAIGPSVAGDWGSYPRGAASVLREAHGITRGLDGMISGPLPVGGLSSSAAVDVAYLLALEAANGLEVGSRDNIHLAQRIENGYIGLNNGILDQSIILEGRPGALTCLDCLTTEFEHVPQPKHLRFDLLIAYSGLSRSLVGTDYNRRVAECEEAARRLLELGGQAVPAAPKLRHVARELFEAHVGDLPEAPARRARHFFGELQRVEDGVQAWRHGDLATLGRLMRESGESSILNYECGSPHTISLHEILNGLPGVHGARFSGAGFRGSCVALTDPGQREAIAAAVARAYPRRHPDVADSYSLHFCHPSGPAELVECRL